MAAYWRIFGASIGLFAIAAGPAGTANALEYFTINVVNEQDFKINLELRDKNCGGGVVLRGQLEAGESREVEICASLKGDGGPAGTAIALEYFTINVVNEQDFKINLELRDKNCGGGVVLRGQLEAGESREVEICASLKGDGGVRATVGSGCSQVKRMEFIELEPGDAINF